MAALWNRGWWSHSHLFVSVVSRSSVLRMHVRDLALCRGLPVPSHHPSLVLVFIRICIVSMRMLLWALLGHYVAFALDMSVMSVHVVDCLKLYRAEIAHIGPWKSLLCFNMGIPNERESCTLQNPHGFQHWVCKVLLLHVWLHE
jgi:hypothetical protein